MVVTPLPPKGHIVTFFYRTSLSYENRKVGRCTKTVFESSSKHLKAQMCTGGTEGTEGTDGLFERPSKHLKAQMWTHSTDGH